MCVKRASEAQVRALVDCKTIQVDTWRKCYWSIVDLGAELGMKCQVLLKP